MTREEQIQQAEINYSGDTIFDGCDYIGQVAKQEAFIAGAKWADDNPQFSKEKFIEKACKCYCDDICDKSRCGMCFHKYDDEYQVKTTFQYNECDTLKTIRKAMEE